MSHINKIETESIQVGLAGAPPIAGVDIWPSMDPTAPFSLQTFGINNHFALTNQIGLYNGIGLQSITGLTSLLGFKSGVGGQANAEPKQDNACVAMDFASPNGNLWGSWKLNGLPIATTSDGRLKINITPLQNSLDKILQLQGVEYDRTDYEKHEIGMVAQEVEKVIPDLVKEDSEGTKILEYQNLTAVLVEAIKEQQEQINTLKQTVQELSTKLENCCP
jgi:hypothetical protein